MHNNFSSPRSLIDDDEVFTVQFSLFSKRRCELSKRIQNAHIPAPCRVQNINEPTNVKNIAGKCQLWVANGG